MYTRFDLEQAILVQIAVHEIMYGTDKLISTLREDVGFAAPLASFGGIIIL